MLGKLLRWYYKNSYNAKYVVELETELDKIKQYVEDNIVIERDDVTQKKEIMAFIKRSGKYSDVISMNCNLRVGGYVIYKITYHNNDYYYNIKHIKSNSEYSFYGRAGFIKCSSNNRFVDMTHHNNYNIYRDTLAKVPELTVGYI